MSDRIDMSRLPALIREKRDGRSFRKVAKEVGISFATLSRVERGARPDLASLTLLCQWLELSPHRFLVPEAERVLSPLDEAVLALKSDPRLTDVAASQIVTVLQVLYGALASPTASPQPDPLRSEAARPEPPHGDVGGSGRATNVP